MWRILCVFVVSGLLACPGTGLISEQDVGDLAQDPGVEVDMAQEAEVEVAGCGGQVGCECATSVDCQSGLCVQTAEKWQCSKECDDDSSCPDGWKCLPIPGGTARGCFDLFANLCKPCKSDVECIPIGGDFSGISFVCIEYGPEGKYCGAPCGENRACPEGYTCETLGGEVTQCLRSSGQCRCTERFRLEGAATVCYKENEFGRCYGEKTCQSDCSASTPEKEKCGDGIDNDCNGLTDEAGCEGCVFYFKDEDYDGFGLTEDALCLEEPKHPYIAKVGGDCDDTSADIKPGAIEICNGLDDNCDGNTDPVGTFGCQNFYPDEDGDGYGAFGMLAKCLCEPQGVYTAIVTGDCNDGDASVYPGAREVCDGRDNNCNGETDEDLLLTFYEDLDNDGFGSPVSVQACTPPQGFVTLSGDCDDNDNGVYPGATEVCDGKDNDCDGHIDEGLLVTFYLDFDGDGWGGPVTIVACSALPGYVERSGDCNDFNPDIHPEASEACNDIDDNCNGLVDDGLPTFTIYKDNDGDGFAPANAPSVEKCNVPTGWTLVNNPPDCNDSDITVYPKAPEICYDGKDNDCDGFVDRLCFTPCAGSWPYLMHLRSGYSAIQVVDLDGDGISEVLVHNSLGFAIVSDRGTALYEYSGTLNTYSRGLAVTADIDDYDKFGTAIQTLEVLTGNGHRPRFYKLNNDRTVTLIENTLTPSFDRSKFMVADFDNDGVVEFVTSTASNVKVIRIFRYNRANGTIDMVAEIADPDRKYNYANGRILTDLDGDNVLDIVFSNGAVVDNDPSFWSGKIYAYRTIINGSALSWEPYCPVDGCFSTEENGLYPGGIWWLIRFPETIAAMVYYYESNISNYPNPVRIYYREFDLNGNVLSSVEEGWAWPYDVDDDGETERIESLDDIGLWDLDGDGIPERITSEGGYLVIQRFDPILRRFETLSDSSKKVSLSDIAVGALWDIDFDGRLDVLVSDSFGSVWCYSLGEATWNPKTSMPPHITPFLRTYQWDPYEPNDGADLDEDGLPDVITRVPSAMTARGAFYGFLSSPDDKDYYLINSAWNGKICLDAPPQREYVLEVYSFSDKWNNDTHEPGQDGRPDGLVWTGSTGVGGSVCYIGSRTTPSRGGEYKFVVGVRSVLGYSADRPYWLQAPK